MRRLLPLLAFLAAAPAARAQSPVETGRCDLVESQRAASQNGVIDVTGPLLVRCEGGAELRAQNGVVNRNTDEVVLTGNVFFQDPQRRLTADRATYSAGIGRLYATGNVVFSDLEQGTTLRGPELEYFRAMQSRPQAQVNAGQRPHLSLLPKKQQPAPSGARDTAAQPLDVDADRMTILGDNDLSAFGAVVLRRGEMRGRAERAHFQGATGDLELRQDAVVETDQYRLEGQVIQARLVEGKLENVHARTRARLAGDNLTVDAPDLQLLFADNELQRAIGRRAASTAADSSARVVAVARSFRLEADSMQAELPRQRLERVVAVGHARGETIDTTRADSLAAPDTAAASRLTGTDWIVGDTITGHFALADSAAPQSPPGPTPGRTRRWCSSRSSPPATRSPSTG